MCDDEQNLILFFDTFKLKRTVPSETFISALSQFLVYVRWCKALSYLCPPTTDNLHHEYICPESPHGDSLLSLTFHVELADPRYRSLMVDQGGVSLLCNSDDIILSFLTGSAPIRFSKKIIHVFPDALFSYQSDRSTEKLKIYLIKKLNYVI